MCDRVVWTVLYVCMCEALGVNVLGDEAVLVYLLGGKNEGILFVDRQNTICGVTYSASISVVWVQPESAMRSSPGSSHFFFAVLYLFGQSRRAQSLA